MASTAIAASIPVISSFFSTSERAITGELLMILAAGSCRFDKLAEQFIAATFIVQLGPAHAVWALFAQFLAVLRYAQTKAGGASAQTAIKPATASDAPHGLDQDRPELLLKDVRSQGDVAQAIAGTGCALLTLMRSWSKRQVLLTLLLGALGPMFVVGQACLASSGLALRLAHEQREHAVFTQLFMSILIFFPALFDAGLLRTVQGASNVGIGSFNRICASAGILGTGIYYQRLHSLTSTTLGHSVVTSVAALICGWIWLYRSRSSVTVTYAASFLIALLGSRVAARATSTQTIDLSIPFILLRLQLAAAPPSPRPEHEAEAEKRKPDPQKGLTPWEERDVQAVLEFGWYTMLRVGLEMLRR